VHCVVCACFSNSYLCIYSTIHRVGLTHGKARAQLLAGAISLMDGICDAFPPLSAFSRYCCKRKYVEDGGSMCRPNPMMIQIKTASILVTQSRGSCSGNVVQHGRWGRNAGPAPDRTSAG
jgi:hypothetical protein